MNNTNTNESTAAMLEKLASSLEAFATTIEQNNKPQTTKVAMTADYGTLASEPAKTSAEDRFASWLGY